MSDKKEGMDAVTTELIGQVCESIIENAEKELFDLTQDELERYWFFKYNPAKRLDFNLYEFHDMLGLYENYCRRWEEHFNGHVCLVERVRDKYLMPKIRELLKTIGELALPDPS